jgi:hypothetical protein
LVLRFHIVCIGPDGPRLDVPRILAKQNVGRLNLKALFASENYLSYDASRTLWTGVGVGIAFLGPVVVPGVSACADEESESQSKKLGHSEDRKNGRDHAEQSENAGHSLDHLPPSNSKLIERRNA